MATKYRSKQVVAPDGNVFDSRLEHRRWCELCLLQRAGVISDLQRQVTYELIPTQREPEIIGPRGGVKPGKVLEKAITYTADFVYTKDGETVVEDTKGFKTEAYVMRRKLMLYLKGIKIKEVTKNGT